MKNIVRPSKHLIPVESIALFEPFVAPTDPPLRTAKEFKARIVLLDRVSILAEETPERLTSDNNFRFIAIDRVGTNPSVKFRVEVFTPAENFKPSKPYLSRLVWTDGDGNSQSKLLLASPEEVLAVVVRGEVADQPTVGAAKRTPRRAPRSSSSRRVAAPVNEPA